MRGRASVPVEIPPLQLFVVVERGPVGMRVRLAPSDRGGERFAVTNQGLGIVPIEFHADGVDGSLTEAYHIFRQLELPATTPTHDRLTTAFDAWRDALARSGVGLRLERRAHGVPLPPMTRAPDSRGTSLRPWDIELTAIEAGLRQVVKLDRVPPDYVRDLRENTLQRGLLVEIVTPREPVPDGGVTLIVSRDDSTLARASDLEQRLLVRGSAQGADGASAKMGELLGYPPCCSARFARVAEHNDTNLAWALLPGIAAPASPYSQWLQPGLALLSHSPCSLECAASIDLGRQILDAVDTRESGFAQRWRSIAARLQVVDHRGNRIALAVDGPLEEPQRVAAAELLGSGGPDANAPELCESLVGKEVCAEAGGAVIPDSDWYAAYVADHRGEA